jgi:hypothetical protein
MIQSRRSLIRLVGMLLPSLAMLPYARRKALEQPTRPNLYHDGESVSTVRKWLDHHGVTLEKLDFVDAGRTPSTSDLRRSFRDDPLISASGLLLPTGFCRYCLTKTSGDNQPRVS